MSRPGLLAALIFSGVAAAQPELGFRDLLHARSLAMGGAYRATGLGVEAVHGNPASLALFKRYQVELSGSWDATTKFGFLTSGVMDSATSEVAGGVTYHFLSLGRGEERSTAHLTTLALALPLSQRIHLGASGRYLRMSGAGEANAVTPDAGLLVRVTESLALSVSGHNLVDTYNPELPRHYVLSAAFVGGLFCAAFDLRADPRPEGPPRLAWAGGLEYIVGEAFPLRAGYQYDSLRGTHFVSGGIGFLTQGGGADFGYRHELGGSEGRMLALTLKMQVQ